MGRQNLGQPQDIHISKREGFKKRAGGELVVNRCRVLIRRDEKFLEMDGDGGCQHR